MIFDHLTHYHRIDFLGVEELKCICIKIESENM